jgi:hypothetical protein
MVARTRGPLALDGERTCLPARISPWPGRRALLAELKKFELAAREAQLGQPGNVGRDAQGFVSSHELGGGKSARLVLRSLSALPPPPTSPAGDLCMHIARNRGGVATFALQARSSTLNKNKH